MARSFLLVAQNGQQALGLVQHHCTPATPSCPALILLDISMPIMDGFEFLEAFAELPVATKQEAVIIVMLTTSITPGTWRAGNSTTLPAFLTNP